MKRRRIYLDVAASLPVTQSARRAFLNVLLYYGNPSSSHEEGRQAREILEAARETIARLAGVKSHGVVFTGNATEANNLAIRGTVAAHLASGHHGASEVFFHPGAHASLTGAAHSLKDQGVRVLPLPLTGGVVDTETLKKQITKDTVLVSLEAVSPHTGMRFNTKEVERALSTLREAGNTRKILLHVDASQLPLVESIELTRLGADLVSIDAQKVGGVRGIGALLIRKGVSLKPVLFGGGQERGLRPGTETPALAAAFAEALDEADCLKDTFRERALRMRERIHKEIRTAIPDAQILGGKHTAPHILTLALPGRDTDYLVALLDEKGFAVATKSACEANAEYGSKMAFFETGNERLASSTLRISFSQKTKEKELQAFVRALIEAVRFLDRGAS